MTISLTIQWWMPTLWLAVGAVTYLPASYLTWHRQSRFVDEDRLREAKLDTFRNAMIHRIGWKRALAYGLLRIVVWPPIVLGAVSR